MNNNNNNNSDILTSSNISNEYSNIQNTKYARENTVIYLFIYFWFIKLHGSNDRTVSGQLIEKDLEEVLIAKSAYESGDGLEYHEKKST